MTISRALSCSTRAHIVSSRARPCSSLYSPSLTLLLCVCALSAKQGEDEDAFHPPVFAELLTTGCKHFTSWWLARRTAPPGTFEDRTQMFIINQASRAPTPRPRETSFPTRASVRVRVRVSRLASRVSCLVSRVSCLVSRVACLVSRVSCLVSRVSSHAHSLADPVRASDGHHIGSAPRRSA
jgi:hypothetical protein